MLARLVCYIGLLNALRIKRDGDIFMLEEDHVYTINMKAPREFTKKKIDKVVNVQSLPSTIYSTMMQKIRALLPNKTKQLPLIPASDEKNLSDMLNITRLVTSMCMVRAVRITTGGRASTLV